VCRVKPGGSGDGSSWSNAAALQSALANAACTQIWVKYGVYKPGPSASDAFTIPPGVAVYGGFGGSETTLAERTLAAMAARPPSILSGDIDNNDTDANNNHIDESAADIQGTNSNNVLIIDGTSVAGPVTASTILDGFVITGGSATSAVPNGGGLICHGAGVGSECSPTLRNLWFAGNHADFIGGALYNDGNSGGVSSPTVSEVTFSGNTAQFGGAVDNDAGDVGPGTSSPTFTNVTFSGNSSDQSGGAMYNFATGSGSTSSPVLTNVTFTGNTAVSGWGGAIDQEATTGGVGDLQLDNVILWGDSASAGPEILLVENAAATINYSIVQGGDGGIGYANGDSGTPFASGNSNQNTDPVLGPLQDNDGFAPTHVPSLSVVDTGDYSTCPATDERGVPRFQAYNCDIGAVEYRAPRVRVSISGQGMVSAESQPPPILFTSINNCTGNCQAYYDGEAAPNSLYPVALDITPDSNWVLQSVTGCDGALSGSVYFTADIDQLTGPASSSTSCTVQVTFVPVAATTTLSSNLNPSQINDAVTFTATVTPNSPATATPTGAVSFYDGGNLISGCVGRPLDSQNPPQVTCTTSVLTQGVHAITAQYGGDSYYIPPAQLLSAPLTQAVASLPFGSRCYVTTAGLDVNDGSSWANAKTLQGALDEAGCAEIWVATGVYQPVVPAVPGSPTAAEQSISFRPLPGVALYGGFAGTETSLSQRTLATIAANPSILSGDIGNDDANTGGVVVSWQDITGANSFHVVYIDGVHAFAPVTVTTIIDGFTITAGYASDFGGGMYCDGLGRDCSPMLRNLVFAGNLSDQFGGALFNEGSHGVSSPTLSNVVFSGNAAPDGGAMLNDAGYIGFGLGANWSGGVSSPRLDNVWFSSNTSSQTYGGGAAAFNLAVYGGVSKPLFNDVSFSGNDAYQTGSAVLNYGLACTSGTTVSPVFTNVTFSGNSVSHHNPPYGGGAVLVIADNGCINTLRMNNVTFSSNIAVGGDAAAISNLAIDASLGISTTPGVSSLVLTNVILWDASVPEIIETGAGATATLDHSIVQNGDAGITYLFGAVADTPFASGQGNLNANPLLGPLQLNGGLTPTQAPAAGSPAIDAGRSDSQSCSLYDQNGLERPQGPACDIGAVEVASPNGSDHIFHNGFDGP
jgi:hypothetical protein